MKKTYAKRTLRAVAMILALWLVTACFGRDDRNYFAIRGFYLEPRDSLDVVFLGSSEVSADVCSVYAYGQTGLTGYQYSIDSNLPSLYLPQLKEILSRQSPQAVVVEVNGFLIGSEKDLLKEPTLRVYLDATRLSPRKTETLSRLPLEEDRASYLFPFIKFHTMWEQTREWTNYLVSWPMIRFRGYSLFKGYLTKPVLLDAPDPFPLPGSGEKLDLCGERVWEYLREFADYCAENRVPVVFARFPHHLSSEREVKAYRRFLTVKEYLTERGFPCLDLQECQEDLGIRREDYYNESHLNLAGQEKLTSRLMETLRSDFNVEPGNLSASERRHWDNCLENYRELRELYERSIGGDERFIYEEIRHFLRVKGYI